MPMLDDVSETERVRAEARACPAPDPAPHGPTRFIVPKGAVDTQAHVIGLPPAYPFVKRRSYTPPEATIAQYIAMLDATGMTYGVLIQVSVHGTDNRLMLEALKAHPDRLKGIAVVELGAPERVYRDLKEAGVVGLRLNDLYDGGVHLDDMARYDALCSEMGWHLQFLTDARRLPERAHLFHALRVPFVIDHMGHFPTSAGLDHPGFETLLSLVREGGHVKLSGAFRCTVEGAPWRDTIPFARALHAAAPDRCVWGSDWPHVAHWAEPMMNVGDQLDLLADWVPDEAARRRVLVDNAHRLYGFGAA